MPRQDVPYGGAICRLRERIAEIFDKLGEKLHTINGVPGDGDGNVKIISGSSAVVITNDPTQNEIAVSLDTSQLPAASVSSVNGQTGAVSLDAGDIPTVGGDVQADLQDLANDISGNTAAINAEALARQGADSTLQTNINAVTASLPAAAAAAVAADPTVAQLATDVPNKLDKITSGSSLKAYTHTGATQGETSVVDGTAANSLGIRDANGRMQAADPASGATDKTLVTANWVSQTGDSSPNNLIHKSGNETKAGNLAISVQGIDAYPSGWHGTTKTGSVGKYTVFGKFRNKGAGQYSVIDVCQNSNTAIALGRFMVHMHSATSANGFWIYRRAKGSNNPLTTDCMYIASDGTDLYLVMKLIPPYGGLNAREWLHVNYGGVQNHSGSIEWLSGNDMVILDDLSSFTNSWQVTE